MWLSAISRRTPKGYFLFLTIGLVLAAFPLFFLIPPEVSLLPFDPSLLDTYVQPLLILVLAVACNRLFVVSDLFQPNTLWPGHFLLLLMLMFTLRIPAVQMAVHATAGMLILYRFLSVQYNRDARVISFNTGLYAGIAACMDLHLVLLAPFLLLGLRSLKPLQLKEYLVFLMGLAAPFYFLWGYGFVSGNSTWVADIFHVNGWFRFPEGFHWRTSLPWLLLAVLTVWSTLMIFSRMTALPVRLRRIATATLYLILGSWISAAADSFSIPAAFYLIPGLTLYATLLMIIYSKNPVAEIIHLIFAGAVLGVLIAGNP